MWAHLWTGSSPPSDYKAMLLCERFGAAVLTLDEDFVSSLITMWDVESEVRKARAENRK